MLEYMNTDTGVIWTEEEFRKAYEQFKRDMEDPKDSFEEYLEDLIRKGELIKVTKYYIIDNHGNVCGEADNRNEIEIIFDNYSPEEIERDELEIIAE